MQKISKIPHFLRLNKGKREILILFKNMFTSSLKFYLCNFIKNFVMLASINVFNNSSFKLCNGYAVIMKYFFKYKIYDCK